MHVLFHIHARIQTDTSRTYQVFVSDYKELFMPSLRLPEYKQQTVQQ